MHLFINLEMIFILIAGIVILVLLISLLKIHAFIALTLVALFVGIMNGIPLSNVMTSITSGIGNTLGPLILILGLGIVLGSVLTESGAVDQITNGLIRLFGARYIKVAMAITGFSVGIALFYNAGFIVLIPLAYSVSARTKLPLIYIATAMASALSITHGFLPPHPGPTAIVGLLKADIGKTLLYGLIVSIPAVIAAGIILPEFLLKIKSAPPIVFIPGSDAIDKNKPSFLISLLLALLPVLLMAFSTLFSVFSPQNDSFIKVIKFFGDPVIALLIAVLISLIVLSTMYENKFGVLIEKSTSALSAVAAIILIIGAGGAFKQIGRAHV